VTSLERFIRRSLSTSNTSSETLPPTGSTSHQQNRAQQSPSSSETSLTVTPILDQLQVEMKKMLFSTLAEILHPCNCNGQSPKLGSHHGHFHSLDDNDNLQHSSHLSEDLLAGPPLTKESVSKIFKLAVKVMHLAALMTMDCDIHNKESVSKIFKLAVEVMHLEALITMDCDIHNIQTMLYLMSF
jgi:hypothetical protein